jgi:hypothetical protein
MYAMGAVGLGALVLSLALPNSMQQAVLVATVVALAALAIYGLVFAFEVMASRQAVAVVDRCTIRRAPGR